MHAIRVGKAERTAVPGVTQVYAAGEVLVPVGRTVHVAKDPLQPAMYPQNPASTIR